MDNELNHWGIKGMKWGVRRFQNKDGTLTAAGKKRYGDDDETETVEERRARVLKSTNAEEIYKNKDILTTAEIRERMDRINVERQLSSIAASTKQSGMDKVDKMLKIGRKINEVYEFTNTPVMKSLKKQLGLSKGEPKRKTLKEIWDNRDKLSDKDLKDAFARATTEKNIKKMIDELEEATKPKPETKTEAKPEPKSEPKKENTKAEYSTDGVNWFDADISEAAGYYSSGKDYTTSTSFGSDSYSSVKNSQVATVGFDYVQKAFTDDFKL